MTYDWMLDRATEFYKIEVTADLTESQANEIVKYSQEMAVTSMWGWRCVQ